MQVKGNKNRSIGLKIGFAGFVLLTSGLFATQVMAQVKGSCANCHTMHNSQSSNTMVHVGAGAGWDTATNQLTGGAGGQQDQLLASDCVGCHSASDNTKTIIDDGFGNLVPTVYSMDGNYPTGIDLAGGNFALMGGATDIYGHNVLGISDVDTTITISGVPGAPGVVNSNCANSCHDSLAKPVVPATWQQFNYGGVPQGQFNGCKACHNKVAHHDANDPTYRFLGGHGNSFMPGLAIVDGGGVPNSFESTDWEMSRTAGDHNFYKSQTDEMTLDSIGRFCAGCHAAFHAMGIGGDFFTGIDNGGDDNVADGGLANAGSGAPNPWLRHPTNVAIPLDPASEFIGMDGAAYSFEVPVAQDPADVGNEDVVNAGDQVMCLSCHRAHASQYPDALRFDYTKMTAHNAPGFEDTGCFYCHLNKDT